MDTITADDIGAFPGSGDVVVTGTRMRAPPRAQSRSQEASLRARASVERGDWNACTIDDPARSLVACPWAGEPAGPGKDREADAQIADGLKRAWSGDLRGAIAAFGRAIEREDQSWLAYLNRGLARERSGDRRGALADLDRAVRLSPESARAYYHRSLLRERIGDGSGASADAKRALALDPAYRAVIR
ncbi:MAG TPA: tetratricopeptide repeat protein [Sphingomonas sp.]|nr:tetratricopeptide repeat protein [Sphingomonas sp.]